MGSTFDQDTGRDYGDALADLSIAFIITRDTRYVDKAREIAAELANAPDWGQQLAIAHISIGFAFAWDFMYDHFSDGERNDIRNAIRSR